MLNTLYIFSCGIVHISALPWGSAVGAIAAKTIAEGDAALRLRSKVLGRGAGPILTGAQGK